MHSKTISLRVMFRPKQEGRDGALEKGQVAHVADVVLPMPGEDGGDVTIAKAEYSYPSELKDQNPDHVVESQLMEAVRRTLLDQARSSKVIYEIEGTKASTGEELGAALEKPTN